MLTAQRLDEMQRVNIGAVAADTLADVSGLRFDNTLPRKEWLAQFLSRAANPRRGCENCVCRGRPDAAETVKQIYSLFLQGSSKRAVSLHLNEHGIPSPTAYRRMKGLPGSYAVGDNPMWSARMIHEVLTNEVYTGDLVQGRHRVKSYKVHQIEAVPEEDWVRVPNTHEAIIDREMFDKVQGLLKRDTRTSPKGREVHLFSGFLRCADCGKALTRSLSGKYVYYACST